MNLSNSEIIMLTEMQTEIENLKKTKMKYEDIVKSIAGKSEHHWLVTNKESQNKVAWVALFLWVMNDKQKKDFLKMNNLLNEIGIK